MTIKELLMSSSNYYPHFKFLPGSSTREYCISALISILIDVSGFASSRLNEDHLYFLCTNEFIKDLYHIDWSDTTISDYFKEIKKLGIIDIKIERNSVGHNIRYVKLNDQILIDMYKKANQNLSVDNQNPIAHNQDLYDNNKEETKTINKKNLIMSTLPSLDKKDTYNKEKELRNTVDAVVNFFNSTCGTNYRATTNGTVKHIKARLKEGFSLQDLCDVIQFKYKEWGVRPIKFSNGQMSNQYLRPSTLFSGKFEEYLQQARNNKNSEGVIASVAPLKERSNEVY